MKPLFLKGKARFGRPMLSGVSALLLSSLLLSPPSQAADPASGTVSDTAPQVSWAGTQGGATASATCGGPNDPECDNFSLTISPGSFDSYLVRITLTPLGGDDWDLQVYDADGGVVGSSGNAPGSAEFVTLNNPVAGTYTVAAAPYATPAAVAAALAGLDTFSASASIEETAPVVSPPGVEQVEFYSYADPNGHAFGEPGAGINWQSEPSAAPGTPWKGDGTGSNYVPGADNGGAIMYLSGLDTLRIRLNDCTAPATYLDGPESADAGEWVERNVPWHVNSLDPIIFTDHLTGRTASSQLSAKSSLLGLSDDDGESWFASPLGAGINSGVDHQTVGGGRLSENGPLYQEALAENYGANGIPHGLYYCSQDIALANCAISLDGGVVFQAAVPMYNLTECGGLHGHVDVSPVDGTAYVPNSNCQGEQGIVISEDNNINWRVRTVPASGSSSSDPSVGIGRGDEVTDGGRVYLGYDNSGKPYAAVTDDKGETWYNITNVGEGFGIQSTAFPEMIAGDDDRAAFAFLGSTTQGAIGDNPNFAAEWHLYVAMTFDGGKNWTTTKVDPNDPVQRGTICGGGFGGCDNGTRNLLDFNDIQIDRRGRPVVIYADGCTGDCVSDPNINTLDNLSTIARLKSPKGLFAAFDAERQGEPDWPLASAAKDTGTGDVTVTWAEPGDGGHAISNYRVFRDGAEVAVLSPATFSWVDKGTTSDHTYRVIAENALGTSADKAMSNGKFAACSASYDVLPGDSIPNPEESPCDFLGVTILTDQSGDSDFDLTPAEGPAAYDVTRMGISESFELDANQIAFNLHVHSTETLPADSYWPVQFTGPDGIQRWVRMRTVGVNDPVFEYGTGATNSAKDGDAAGYLVAGTGVIRMIVDRAAIGAPDVGDTLTGFQVRVRASGGVFTPDNMPGSLAFVGSYSVFGTENCVEDVNHAPVANDDSATTTADTAVVIPVLDNDTDADGDALSISGLGSPAHGSVTDDGQQVTYTPAPGYTGDDAFTYTINDGNGGTDQATVFVTVHATSNSAPTARDDHARTPRGKSIEIFVLANDSDPDDDALTITGLGQPAHGAVTEGEVTADGRVTSVIYTPENGFTGTDRFSYTISDGRGGTDTAEVEVKVSRKDKDDDGSSDDDSSADDSGYDDGSSDDGSSRDDGCSRDADCDGMPDDSDSDDDNDGLSDANDADDDGDGIDDEYDAKGYDEVQAQNATVPAFGSATYTLDADAETASMFVVATGAGSEMLQIQISDSAGLPVGTTISGIGKLTSHVQTFLMGTYTITISNPTPSAIDFEMMTVRQQF